MSQTTPVKNETLREIKGELDKKDSLLKIADSIIIKQDEAISIKDKLINVHKQQVHLKTTDADLWKLGYDNLAIRNKDLEKLNKKLTFRVKLFKGLSIGIPIIGAATFGYFTYVR